MVRNEVRTSSQKNIVNPELNAVQNWIIFVQGFLIRCATFAYTKNYKEIMDGISMMNY